MVTAISPQIPQQPSQTETSCIYQTTRAALYAITSPIWIGAWIIQTAYSYLFSQAPGVVHCSGPSYLSKDLRHVLKTTEQYASAGHYDYHGQDVTIPKCSKTTRQNAFFFDTWTYPSQGHRTEFSMANQDAVYAGVELKKRYAKVALLNPANAYRAGGGARGGAAAMEEDLCRRSPLLKELEKHSYPLSGSTLLYTENVPFFRFGRDREYGLMAQPVSLNVITSAAIDLNPGHKAGGQFHNNPKAFKDETRRRVHAQLWQAAEAGNDAVVLTAFGCGAFRNKPEEVAQIYREVINTQFKGVFKNITFAIINDHNTGHAHNPRGNYLPFADVFLPKGKKV